MLAVETIGKIRLKHRQGKYIRSISRAPRLSHNTLRKVLLGDESEFGYQRSCQPYPKLEEDLKDQDGFLEKVTDFLIQSMVIHFRFTGQTRNRLRWRSLGRHPLLSCLP
ncbi:MAG: hypothetical protein KKE29_02870 [Proteobacteria bacterium]|nr:hypothetical protein [Pseudomonadota bacterium]